MMTATSLWAGLLAVCVTSLWPLHADATPLNDYILDYQPLQFDPAHLQEKHSRVRRSIDPYLRWTFKAYGRTFNVQLEPSQSVFSPDHQLVFGSEPAQPVDTSYIYEGKLAGDPTSSVHLSILGDSIAGHIIVSGQTIYHIEPARNHALKLNTSDIHTIIYPEARMELDPYRHKRAATGMCGSDSVYEKLRNMWTPVDQPASSSSKRKRETMDESRPHNAYTAAANVGYRSARRKRDLRDNEKTCFMSLRADKLLYDHILSKYSSQDQSRVQKAKEEILSIFASHVKALNNIYENTMFGITGNSGVFFRGINFQLQKSTIITSCAPPSTWKSGYCTDNLDVSNFLDLTSEENHDEFCLVHTFTYRDFVEGTLGLAWVATPESVNAGVCGKNNRVRDNNNGISVRSLNTGIVTFINFNTPVPTRVSQLTFAHEVGHNFGAQHDKTDVCAPYGKNQPNSADGNYIMFPSATQGNLPNNGQFSPCSKDYIAKVLQTLDPDGRRNYCFRTSGAAFCGNKVVEGGEQCDCGYVDECEDQCCVGRPNNGSPSEGCKRKASAVCSPSEGQCCQNDCRYASMTFKCQEEQECSSQVYCTGINASCPKPQKKPDFATFCNNYGKVCENGECIASVCRHIGWVECFLTSNEGASSEQMCYVSCKKDDTSECISSYDEAKVNANIQFKQLLEKIRTNRPNSGSALGVKRPAGSPCNDYKGYCDVLSKCRNVDAEGPFKQLTELIFNPVTLKKVETWIKDHWWAVLLMCIGVVVFMGVFVKIFGYNTPSKRPSKSNGAAPTGRGHGRSRPQHDKLPLRHGGRREGGGAGAGAGGGGGGEGRISVIASAPPDPGFAYENAGYHHDYNTFPEPHDHFDTIASYRPGQPNTRV